MQEAYFILNYFIMESNASDRLPTPYRQIRASYDEDTITVYQAYSSTIAIPAVKQQKLNASPDFRLSRMTWVKPSWSWMMYRSGYAKKQDQEVVLGIDISREGFEWALDQAVLSTFHPEIHGSPDHWKKVLHDSPVRIQWDPERDWKIQIIDDVRAIQIGLSGEAVRRYVDDWIIHIEDVTPLAHEMANYTRYGAYPTFSPDRLERVYPLRDELRTRLIPRHE